MASPLKKGARLIDLVIAEAYDKNGYAVHPGYRDALHRARKFILDESMSAHLADLTCAPFLAQDQNFAFQIADGARRTARLPFPTTWIEYDAIARRRRTMAEYPGVQGTSSGQHVSEDEIMPVVGWLLEQHPYIPTAFRMTEFCQLTGDDGKERGAAIPFSFAWVCDDNTVLPWRNFPFADEGRRPSEIATGLMGYVTPHAGVIPPEHFWQPTRSEHVQGLLYEVLGGLRAVWTLLATLTDLPVTYDAVRPARGHMLRGGNYRRFMDHHVIHLNVPTHRSLKTLAIRALIASRRKAHEVSGHWRNDWRHPRTPGCEHDWINFNENTLACRHCGGRRIYIAPHQRGDASRGYVTHEYRVQRKEQVA